MPAPTTKLTPREAAVLQALTQAADEGEPCPSGAALSRMLGYKSPSTTWNVTAALVRKGYITMLSGDRWRQATILATGRSTARGRSVTTGRPPLTKALRPAPPPQHPVLVDPDRIIREGRNLASVSLRKWHRAHAEAYA